MDVIVENVTKVGTVLKKILIRRYRVKMCFIMTNYCCASPINTCLGLPKAGKHGNTTFINPRGVYCTWFVSVSVCLLPLFLRLRATRQQNSDTNRFIATLASLFKKVIFV